MSAWVRVCVHICVYVRARMCVDLCICNHCKCLGLIQSHDQHPVCHRLLKNISWVIFKFLSDAMNQLYSIHPKIDNFGSRHMPYMRTYTEDEEIKICTNT